MGEAEYRPKVIVKRLTKPFSDAGQRDLLDKIGIYCTALAAVTGTEPHWMASGTFVSVGGHGFVLTAHHVLYGYPKAGIPGVLDFERVGIFATRGKGQPTYLNKEKLLTGVPIGTPPRLGGGPDLAAL